MPITKSPRGEPFKRLTVDHLVRGVSRVEWHLRPDFCEDGVYEFQLQVNRNAGEPADTDQLAEGLGASEWANVGIPVYDQFYAVDDEQRQYGKQLRGVYRVKLRLADNTTYFSNAIHTLGKLSKRQWLQARAIIRRLVLDPTQLEAFDGYLLKRRHRSTVCTECVDPFTNEVRNSDCIACNGTGKIDGYWKSTECQMFDRSPQKDRTHQDPKGFRGTVNDVGVMGRFVGVPQVATRDIWVDGTSDRRYFVDQVQSVAELHGVPIVVEAVLRLAEFSDVIYRIEVD